MKDLGPNFMNHFLTFLKIFISGGWFSIPFVLLVAIAIYSNSGGFFYGVLGLAFLLGLPWSIPLAFTAVYYSDAMFQSSGFFRALVPSAGEWAGVFGGLIFAAFVSLHINGCLVAWSRYSEAPRGLSGRLLRKFQRVKDANG